MRVRAGRPRRATASKRRSTHLVEHAAAPAARGDHPAQQRSEAPRSHGTAAACSSAPVTETVRQPRRAAGWAAGAPSREGQTHMGLYLRPMWSRMAPAQTLGSVMSRSGSMCRKSALRPAREHAPGCGGGGGQRLAHVVPRAVSATEGGRMAPHSQPELAVVHHVAHALPAAVARLHLVRGGHLRDLRARTWCLQGVVRCATPPCPPSPLEAPAHHPVRPVLLRPQHTTLSATVRTEAPAHHPVRHCPH